MQATEKWQCKIPTVRYIYTLLQRDENVLRDTAYFHANAKETGIATYMKQSRGEFVGTMESQL